MRLTTFASSVVLTACLASTAVYAHFDDSRHQLQQRVDRHRELLTSLPVFQHMKQSRSEYQPSAEREERDGSLFDVVSRPRLDPRHSVARLHPYLDRRAVPLNSLYETAEENEKLAGVAVAQWILNSTDEDYLTILEREFNYITPENSGKWGPLNSAPGEWDFTAYDFMVDYAEETGFSYKGHTLVWHSQAPDFINDLTADELQQAIDAHITTTLSRYAGRIYAWDVVNEAIGDDAEYRDSVLYQKLGEDFIANAFYKARSIDSTAKLYYNDYNIAGINPKSNKVYEMLKELKEQGVPVDGIGFQMHLIASSAPGFDELVENFTRFAELGLRVNVSELDVRISDLPWDQPTNLAIQRQVFHRVASACLAVSACEGITAWGITDKYSWVDSTFGEDDPLMWSDTYDIKPAYFGLADGFAGRPADDLGVMPNLVANSEVETNLEGWSSWGAELDRVVFRKRFGSTAVIASNRVDTWDGPVYDLTGLVRAGQSYDVSIDVITDIKARRAVTELNAKFQCVGEDAQFVTLASDTVYFNRWRTLDGVMTVPSCELESAAIYVSGPEARYDIIADNANVRPQTLVPNDEGYGPNILANSFFENGVDGWFGFGDAVVDVNTTTSKSGAQSLYASNRTQSWQGPATSLLGVVVPGASYQLFGWARVDAAANVNATVMASCDGADPQYIGVASQSLAANTWSVMAGTFNVPNCDLTDLTLYFEGPDAEQPIYLDDVYLREVIQEVSDGNLVSNGGFEEGVDGWQAWGDSTITTSTARAHTGDRSALLTNRTADWQGPVYDLLPVIVAGGTYDVTAWGMVDGLAESPMNITVRTVCADGTGDYHQLASLTVNNQDWTELTGSIVLPDCELTQVSLYFDGAPEGVDVYLDDVFVSGTEKPAPANLVANNSFESGLDGWMSWGGALSVTTDQAYDGGQSALLENRTGAWEGPVFDLLAAGLTGGKDYTVSAFGRIAGAAADSMNITLKVTCDDGTSDYLWGGAADVSDAAWTELSGTVSVPDCTLTEASLYFGGPAQEVSVYLDQVTVAPVQ